MDKVKAKPMKHLMLGSKSAVAAGCDLIYLSRYIFRGVATKFHKNVAKLMS